MQLWTFQLSNSASETDPVLVFAPISTEPDPRFWFGDDVQVPMDVQGALPVTEYSAYIVTMPAPDGFVDVPRQRT